MGPVDPGPAEGDDLKGIGKARFGAQGGRGVSVATEAREVETRLLNLMRDPALCRAYAKGVQSRLLSAEGQAILKSLVYAVGKGATTRITIQDLWLCVKSQYRGQQLEPVKKVLDAMKSYDGDERQPGLVKALFDEHSTRLLVREVSSLLAAQLESGKYDLDAARKLLIADAVSDALGPEPINFVEAGKEGLVPERIPTGLSSVDTEFQGGISRCELGIIAGPPKRGKSATLVNIGGHELAACRSVLYISLADLSKRDAVCRFASWLTDKPIEQLVEQPKHMRALQAWFEKKGHKLYVTDWNARHTTLGELDRHIAEAKEREPKLRLILVDRAETVAVPNKYGVLRHELKEIYTELRRIANRHDVAMWADSQADSRAYTSKKVGMDKGSEDKIGKAGVTDLWIGVTRDQEEMDVIWATLDGRRRVEQELHRFRLDKRTFRLTEEASYGAEGEDGNR